MGNIVIVANKSRKQVFAVDIDNKTFTVGSKQGVNVRNFNTKECKYIGDKLNISDTWGTLAYVNKKLGLYGILREFSGKPCIYWVPIKNITDKSDIANIYGNIADVTNDGLDVLEHKWSGNKLAKPLYIKSKQPYVRIKKEELIDILNSDNNDNSEDVEKEKEIDTSENNKPAIDDSNKTSSVNCEDKNNTQNTSEQISDVLEKSLSIINNRLEEVILREKALKEKEDTLRDKMIKLDRTLESLSVVEINDLKDINDFEVDTVVTVDGVNKYRYSTEYIVYELMLKSVQAGDIISIPFDYYRKLKTFIKKGIWQSVDYTKYKCIAEIRLNPNIDDNLLCIVNYDESNEWVKIEVLRQFSIRKATDQEVAMFSIEIAKQQRMNK